MKDHVDASRLVVFELPVGCQQMEPIDLYYRKYIPYYHRQRMMVANMANTATTPPTMVTGPSLQSPPTLSALQPSPTERLNASSTSPTNTSASDGSAIYGLDLAALIAASQQATKQEFPKQQDPQPPLPNPLFTMPDASTLLQFFQQTQQAAMLQAVAQRAAAVQQQAAQQQHVQQQQQAAQQAQQTERKRSYPCTFQFCVICQKDVHSSKLPCHIRQCHVAKPMFQCPACDFTSTYSKNNVKSHMVSLHGLAGDPISYMDRYAPQVEEFMKMCFPNVRGRGRPMQGRGSPRSPASPQHVGAQRRTSQTMARRPSFRDTDLLALAEQQQQQAALLAQGLNPLSIFPSSLFNNNNNTATANNNNNGLKQESTESTEMTVVSAASSIEDVNVPHKESRQMSIISTGSLRSLQQTMRPGDNWQPSTAHLPWTLLNGEQTKDTIFASLPEKIEGIDASEFEEFRQKDEELLSAEHAALVALVREKIELQPFEILFAVHRMDMTIMKSTENLEQLIRIAPSPVDAQRIKDWVEAHPNAQISEDEQFILTLSKVKHLEEKLIIMRHMTRFDSEIATITEQLSSLSTACKALLSSDSLKSLLQLVLTAQNLIYSENSHPISGFVVSQMEDICSYEFPSGVSLLSLLAAAIRERTTDVAMVFDLIPMIESAAKVSFSGIVTSLLRLEENNTRADMEIKESANEHVASFLESSQPRLNAAHEAILSVKEELCSLLSFMAEPLPRSHESFSPETFFSRLCRFLSSLRDLVEQVDV